MAIMSWRTFGLTAAFLAVSTAVAAATGADFTNVATISADAIANTGDSINSMAQSGAAEGTLTVDGQGGLDVLQNLATNVWEGFVHNVDGVGDFLNGEMSGPDLS